jgi:DNA polymerase III subunit epsilon
MKKILWNDLETGSTDPKTGAILQIAAVVEIDGEIVDQFESKIKPLPGKIVSDEALEINGISRNDLDSFPESITVYNQFRSMLNKYGPHGKQNRYTPAGYNNKFDLDFLCQWHLDITGKPYAFWDYLQFCPIDPLSTLQAMRFSGVLQGLADTKLETVCKYFGIEIKAHDALSDVFATRELSHMLFRKLWCGYTGGNFCLFGEDKI